MRRVLLVLCVLLLPAICVADGEPGKKRKRHKPVPPPPGIWWAKAFEPGLLRAAQEGRPVLFCVNALDTEQANLRLRADAYRGAAWGMATRGYVAFPCHPGKENGPGGNSTRYLGTPAKTANDALDYVLKRFGQDLISPQHIILEPDGDVALRKEYYTGVVGPALLRRYLSAISPPLAFTRASIDRAAEIKRLSDLPTDGLAAGLSAWMAKRDGFAGAVALNVLDDELDAGRRAIVIAAFSELPEQQAPLAAYAAKERVDWPDDEPDETLSWVETLMKLDHALGAFAASRAAARTEASALRTRILRSWKPEGEAERLLHLETRLLTGAERTLKIPTDAPEAWRRRLLRAARTANRVERRWPVLETALQDARPAVVRGALMEATPDEVRAQAALVEEALVRPKCARVRYAAACALLRSGRTRYARRVADVLARGMFDVVEGAALYPAVLEALGGDPGGTPEAFSGAIFARLNGGGR